MRKLRHYVLSFVLLASLFLVACGGEGVSFSTANIQRAILAKDEGANQTTTTFAPEDTFYAIVDLANAPDDTKVKAVWTAVDIGDAAAANSILDDVELTSGDGTLTFDLSNSNPWPGGSYKVDLYLNDELDRTLEFRVQAAIGAAPETESAQAEPAQAEPAQEEPAAGGVISTLEGARSAVVQIVAQGSFMDPEVGMQLNAAGAGSGFIIDPSGIAVTNNHVVTGSALLQVYLQGEDRPRNAKILGVSECSDLAVIDIDGDNFPYLQWYDGAPRVGLDVYAAGFPLGDPEFTLTRGVVSKEQADGETSWASVDAVLQHDATINPGNSGGPLIDANGRVVAINYASSGETGQFFAIASDQAQPIIDQLRSGEDVTSIGVNGEAVSDGESIFGIWVASVKSGSPANEAGIEPGDIITKMEGLVLATDGTMSSYCDILRSRNADDTMSIEVLRFSTQEMMEGQLNGDSLEQSFSFAQELGAEVGQTAASAGLPASYTYVTITDDSGSIAVEVPAEWTDTDGSAWTNDSGEIGTAVRAAINLDDFYNTWTTPGMFFGASASLAQSTNEQVLLEDFDYSESCTKEGRYNYEDALYTGLYEVWVDCAGEGIVYVVVTAVPAARNFVIVVGVQIVTDADLEALDHVLNSFIVYE